MEQMEQLLPPPRNAKGHLWNSRRSDEIFRGMGGKGWGLRGVNGLFRIAMFVISKSDCTEVKSRNILPLTLNETIIAPLLLAN